VVGVSDDRVVGDSVCVTDGDRVGDVVGVIDDELVADSVGVSEGSEFGDGASVVSLIGDSVGSCIGSSDGMFCEGSVVALGVGDGIGDDGVGCPRS
jgi:hypothetical protein